MTRRCYCRGLWQKSWTLLNLHCTQPALANQLTLKCTFLVERVVTWKEYFNLFFDSYLWWRKIKWMPPWWLSRLVKFCLRELKTSLQCLPSDKPPNSKICYSNWTSWFVFHVSSVPDVFFIFLSRDPCLPFKIKHSTVAAGSSLWLLDYRAGFLNLPPPLHPSLPLKLCFAQAQWDYTGPWWRIGQMKRNRGRGRGTRMWWIRGLMSYKHCDTVRRRFGRE